MLHDLHTLVVDCDERAGVGRARRDAPDLVRMHVHRDGSQLVALKVELEDLHLRAELWGSDRRASKRVRASCAAVATGFSVWYTC